MPCGTWFVVLAVVRNRCGTDTEQLFCEDQQTFAALSPRLSSSCNNARPNWHQCRRANFGPRRGWLPRTVALLLLEHAAECRTCPRVLWLSVVLKRLLKRVSCVIIVWLSRLT
jgi:hypothetical protein